MQIRHKCTCNLKQEKRVLPPGHRQLKIYEKFIARTYHNHIILPEIRLCGKWLLDMGFDCGKTVLVQHEKNRIVITVESDAVVR